MSHFQLHHLSWYASDVGERSLLPNRTGIVRNLHWVGKAHIRWFTKDDFRTVHLVGGDQEGERLRQFARHMALATQGFDKVLSQLQQRGHMFVSLTRQPGEVTTRTDGVWQVCFQVFDGH